MPEMIAHGIKIGASSFTKYNKYAAQGNHH